MFNLQKRTILPLCALAPLWLAACTESHYHTSPPSLGAPVYEEREPNDDPLFGDFIGGVDRATHLFVVGDVDDDPGPWGDIYDHFEFVTTELASFEVRLESDSIYNDVALGVFDPDTGEMVIWVEDPYGFNWADFTVHQANKAFVLVVAATWGYGSYELELLGHSYAPLSVTPLADGPRPVIEAQAITPPENRTESPAVAAAR
ncbi:MAG: hypothetical protein KDB61_04685 [Planctomycetes bacterium]|nr:hypothetical protein [Planctomycetota bacterium]